MPLRKATIFSSSLADNAGSFTNVTADRLHIRMLDLTAKAESSAGVIGDAASCSIDEIPITQAAVNDSRSHIMAVVAAVQGGTGGVESTYPSKVLAFNRNDLVLDPDEALFMNNTDNSGALDVGFTLNIWYED